MSINPSLYKRLYETLRRCGPFSSDGELRATFADERISFWLDRLPQSDSIRGRIDGTVGFLSEQYDNNLTNGLSLFLSVLVDRLSSDDACRDELANLAREIDARVSPDEEKEHRDKELDIVVEAEDITSCQADTVALKFAQDLYGADRIVAQALGKRGADFVELLPSLGYYKIIPSLGEITARQALFISVSPLYEFDYGEIRQFAKDVLNILQTSAPQTQSLAMTVHGVGYGLDESEVLRAQIAGYFDALEMGLYPPGLRKITIIEKNYSRAQRLKNVLDTILPSGKISLSKHKGKDTSIYSFYSMLLNTVGDKSRHKPFVYVIMPFLEDMEDIFFSGIKKPVNAAGYLCERSKAIPKEAGAFRRVMSRIETASLIVVDLSTSNLNLYLELGYALGKQKPILIVLQEGIEVPYVAQTQNYITYKSISDLEKALAKEIQGVRFFSREKSM